MGYLKQKGSGYIPTTISQSGNINAYSYRYFIDTDIDLNNISVNVTDYVGPNNATINMEGAYDVDTTNYKIKFFEEGTAKVRFSTSIEGINPIIISVGIYANGAYTYIGDLIDENNTIRRISSISYIDKNAAVVPSTQDNPQPQNVSILGGKSYQMLQLSPIIPKNSKDVAAPHGKFYDDEGNFITFNNYGTFNAQNNFGEFEITFTVRDNYKKIMSYGTDYTIELDTYTETVDDKQRKYTKNRKYEIVNATITTDTVDDQKDKDDNNIAKQKTIFKLKVKLCWPDKTTWQNNKASGTDTFAIKFTNNHIATQQGNAIISISTPITEELKEYFTEEKKAGVQVQQIGDEFENVTSASFSSFSASIIQFTYPSGYDGIKYLDPEYNGSGEYTVVETFPISFFGNDTDDPGTGITDKYGIKISTSDTTKVNGTDYTALLKQTVSKDGLFKVYQCWPNETGFDPNGNKAIQFTWNLPPFKVNDPSKRIDSDADIEAYINSLNLNDETLAAQYREELKLQVNAKKISELRPSERYKIDDFFEINITVGDKTTTLYVCVSAIPGTLQAKPINALNFGGNIFNIRDRNAVTMQQLTQMLGGTTLSSGSVSNGFNELKTILNNKLSNIASDINNIWATISNNATETTDLGDIVNQYRTQLESSINNAQGENAAQIYKLTKQLKHLESLIEAMGGSVTAIDDNYDDLTNTLSITLTDTRP